MYVFLQNKLGGDWTQLAKKIFHWQASINMVMRIWACLRCTACGTGINASTALF